MTARSTLDFTLYLSLAMGCYEQLHVKWHGDSVIRWSLLGNERSEDLDNFAFVPVALAGASIANEPPLATSATVTGAPATATPYGAKKYPIWIEEPSLPDDVFENCLVVIETDMFADGSINRREQVDYNTSGNAVLREWDENADGRVNRRETIAYNSRGLISESRVDYDNDGAVDSVASFTYSPSGMLLVDAYDVDADGETDLETRYEYFEWGGVSGIEYWSYREDTKQMQYNYGYIYTYDNERKIVEGRRVFVDRTHERSVFTWEGGNIVRVQIDSGADGRFDRVIEAKYMNDNMTELRIGDYERAPGVTWSTLVRWSFDDFDRMSRRTKYANGHEAEEAYEYDERGRPVVMFGISNVSGRVNITWRYERCQP